MNNKWNLRFLGLAKEVATWSKDPSTKVGAVIVRSDRTVQSIGYNGFPKSMPDNPEWYSNREEKYSRIVHGEVNALIHAGGPVAGCTLYTYPFMPCDRCCVQMIQAGIKRMVAPTPSMDALTRWAAAFDKTRLYCQQSNVELLEVPLL